MEEWRCEAVEEWSSPPSTHHSSLNEGALLLGNKQNQHLELPTTDTAIVIYAMML